MAKRILFQGDSITDWNRKREDFYGMGEGYPVLVKAELGMDNNFNQTVLETDTLVVVDFWAQWCGPCRKLAPVLEQVQAEFKDEIKVVKIDADKNMNTAREYGISSLPSVLIFKDGEVKEFMAGMMQKSAIVSNIKKYL